MLWMLLNKECDITHKDFSSHMYVPDCDIEFINFLRYVIRRTKENITYHFDDVLSKTTIDAFFSDETAKRQFFSAYFDGCIESNYVQYYSNIFTCMVKDLAAKLWATELRLHEKEISKITWHSFAHECSNNLKRRSELVNERIKNFAKQAL